MCALYDFLDCTCIYTGKLVNLNSINLIPLFYEDVNFGFLIVRSKVFVKIKTYIELAISTNSYFLY